MDHGSKKKLDDLSERVEKSKARAREFLESVQVRHYGTTMEDAFGHEIGAIDVLCNSKDKTLLRLSMLALSSKWKLQVCSKHIDRIKQLAVNEADGDVREGALQALGRIFEATDDRQIGELLAKVVRDESAPLDCRDGAYRALCCLGSHEHWRDSGEEESAGAFPDLVDWLLVDKYVAE